MESRSADRVIARAPAMAHSAVVRHLKASGEDLRHATVLALEPDS
jgi:hypothetical protein